MIYNPKPLTGDEALYEIQSNHYVFCTADEILRIRQERQMNVPRNR